MGSYNGPLRVGIGGPVGSGKTALMDLLCKALRERYQIAAITNDIYTKWDAEFLVRSGSLTPDRIAGVETGGCPHTAIREDALDESRRGGRDAGEISRSRPGSDRIRRRQSGRDLLAGIGRSHDLCDRRRCRRQDPLEGGPGITRSDLLVINKIDLAPHVGASLDKMETDAKRMRGERAVRDDQSEAKRRARSHHRIHRGQGRPTRADRQALSPAADAARATEPNRSLAIIALQVSSIGISSFLAE